MFVEPVARALLPLVAVILILRDLQLGVSNDTKMAFAFELAVAFALGPGELLQFSLDVEQELSFGVSVVLDLLDVKALLVEVLLYQVLHLLLLVERAALLLHLVSLLLDGGALTVDVFFDLVDLLLNLAVIIIKASAQLVQPRPHLRDFFRLLGQDILKRLNLLHRPADYIPDEELAVTELADDASERLLARLRVLVTLRVDAGLLGAVLARA